MALTAWIRSQAERAELVLSICTRALLLAKASLLDGLEATTHFGAIDLLREVAPHTQVSPEKRFTDNGKVIVSVGIDMSLYVVVRLLGEAEALKTARYMEYDWKGIGG